MPLALKALAGVAIPLLFATAAQAQSASVEKPEFGTETPLSVREVVDNLDRYAGKVVRVRAVFNSQSHTHRFVDSAREVRSYRRAYRRLDARLDKASDEQRPVVEAEIETLDARAFRCMAYYGSDKENLVEPPSASGNFSRKVTITGIVYKLDPESVLQMVTGCSDSYFTLQSVER